MRLCLRTLTQSIDNGKRKAENGKLLFFGFRLEWKNGPLRLSREQRLLADYAETEQ